MKNAKSAHRYVYGTSILLAASSPLLAASAEKIRFEIPAGTAPATLKEFVRQAGVQMIFDADGVCEQVTQRVSGDLETADALSRMLRDSGLLFEFVNEHTVAILQHSASQGCGLRQLPSARSAGDESGAPIASARNDTSTQTSSGSRPSLPSSVQKVELQEVVVTGTQIRGLIPESSPVRIYTRADIERTGAATVDEFVRQMPENFSSVDASTVGRTNISGFNQLGSNSYSSAGLNLRGIGPGGTLTLINGHRLSSAGQQGDFVDVSMIPLSAVERVEVLTDGASALYGADAVAGVVNFVLRKDFDGAETSLRFGRSTRGGAGEFTASQLFGRAWTAGGVALVYEHDKDNGLLSNERDFIPVQSVPISVVPRQNRDSALLVGHQEIPWGLTLSGDALFSDREFVIDNPFGTFVQRYEGTARQYGSTVSLRRAVQGDWQAELSGSYYKSEQSATANVLGMSQIPTNNIETNLQLSAADLRADGSLFSLFGNVAKGAFGAGFRSEQLADASLARLGFGELQRHVVSAYGELFLPLIGNANRRSLVQRLELSLATRFDDYDDTGSAMNPKVGLLWSPTPGVNIRGTYARSFHAPLLTQLVPFSTWVTSSLPDPAAPSGQTVTLLHNALGNPALEPERSRSFTAGLDFKPSNVPGLTIAATYFNTYFTDRIGTPPIVGSFQLLYSQTDTLRPFIRRSPDLSEVQEIFDNNTVRDLAGAGPEGVQAIFENQPFNLAATRESGIELTTEYRLRAGRSDLGFTLAGNYLLQMDYRSLETTPEVALLNTIAQPMDLRLSGGVSWSLGGLRSSLMVNFSDGYRNSFFQDARIRSWTTINFQLNYEIDSTFSAILDGVNVGLSIQNLTDADPPALVVPGDAAVDLGYDAPNAGPLGRMISLKFSKRWLVCCPADS